MDENKKFIFSNLGMKSNGIVGFVVLQSLYLADRFSNNGLKERVEEMYFFWNYIRFGHIVLVVFSLIFIYFINEKMKISVGDLKKDIYLAESLPIKICLILFFGIIPLFVMFT